MFTGITQYMAKVDALEKKPGLLSLSLTCPADAVKELIIGASVAVDGTCLTVVDIQQHQIHFDVIAETLSRTTLGQLKLHDMVNIERSLKVGDELGGHILSGHVHTTASIVALEKTPNNVCMRLHIAPEWIKYIFPKGFIALTGCSLTIVDVDKANNIFSVHLIPETLKKTNLGSKQENDRLNVEIELQTLTIVETVERVMKEL